MIFAREANRPDPKLAIPIAGDDAEAVKVAAGLVGMPDSTRWSSASSPTRGDSNAAGPATGNR